MRLSSWTSPRRDRREQLRLILSSCNFMKTRNYDADVHVHGYGYGQDRDSDTDKDMDMDVDTDMKMNTRHGHGHGNFAKSSTVVKVRMLRR